MRRLLQHRYTLRVDDALIRRLGQRVRARVQPGEVDAAVGHAGEDFGTVVQFGIGGEDGVAFLLFLATTAHVQGIGGIEWRGRPVRRA